MDASILACLRLTKEIDCERHRNHPYCGPFVRYVMEWPHHLPIKTIIIGQNPYPGDIFPELGAALAYDESKTKSIPPSIKVLAEDLYNHDGTNRRDTIEAFRDSWKMLDVGVLMINETVFHKISGTPIRPNTGGHREMEAQVRAIQFLLIQGFKMGQTSVNLIGMGIGASMMTSILRPWCPTDLISTRVMTCSNPAAFSSLLGDSSSQSVTLGKSHISKILSEIVKLCTKMPPKTSQVEKRRQQNIDTLNKAVETLKETGVAQNNELRSFRERMLQADPTKPFKATMEDLCESLGSAMKAVDRHNNAMDTHSATFLMILNSMPKEYPKHDSKPSQLPQQSTQSVLDIPKISSGPRRRVVRNTSSQSVPKIDPIMEDTTSEIVEATSVAKAPSRSRRRVTKTESVAGTEYTIASSVGNSNPVSSVDMEPSEKTYMSTFANWFKTNYADDPSYEVILSSAADSRTTDNPLSKAVLEYARSRKSQDVYYDPYDELNDPDSASSIWIKEYMSTQG